MPVSDETAYQLLPEGRPESEFANPLVLARLRELEKEFGRDGLLPRSLVWHSLVATVLSDGIGRIIEVFGIPRRSAFDVAVGFIDLRAWEEQGYSSTEGRMLDGHVFGTVLFDTQFVSQEPLFSVRDLGVWDERLKGIPLIYIPVASVPHSPPSVLGTTSTCWAGRRKGSGPSDILTAAHAFGWYGAGTTVLLDNGSNGQVNSVCQHPVDAALIRPSSAPSGAMQPVVVEPVPVPQEPFEFVGNASSLVQGKLDQVHILPGVSDPYSPQRIYLDTAGQPGDSGALVRSTVSGRALGIYTGKLENANAVYIHSQAMQQACDLLDIDLWE